jgi:prepilin-type processing-associated H-X9-DG protein
VGAQPGYTSAPPNAGDYVSCFCFLLPFLEQNNIWLNSIAQTSTSSNFLYGGAAQVNGNNGGVNGGTDYYNVNGHSGAWGYNTPPYDKATWLTGSPSMSYILGPNGTGIAPWAYPRIKGFECPSDSLDFVPAQGSASPGYYGYMDCLMACQPSGAFMDFLQCPTNIAGGIPIGGTNYVGCAGYEGTLNPKYCGIYYDSSKTKPADITDGLSLTFAFGESTFGPAATTPGPRDWLGTWAGTGALPTGWGMNPIPGNGDDFLAYSSKNNGVVNFAFADGSVHPMNSSMDFNTYVYLSGKADGVQINQTKAGF